MTRVILSALEKGKRAFEKRASRGRRKGAYHTRVAVTRKQGKFRILMNFAKTLAAGIGVALALLAGANSARGRDRREPRPGAVPLSGAPPQTVELRLPVNGIWGVIQGFDSGDTHVGYAAYALDLVPAERLPALPPEQRKRLEDFPCFGQPVLAPADGRVLWAVDGAVDHVPNWVGKHEAGNFVIIEHAPGEYTELRHLRRGSVRVAVGERVRQGQPVAACGNSGNAKTPHLHIGFLGSVDPIATRPMVFSHYQVLGSDGKWRPGAGPLREKEIVRPTP